MKLFEVLQEIDKKAKLSKFGQSVVLVAVSKTKSVADIMELYQQGQRAFGENYVEELVEKAKALPKDIKWHFIGHLQTNKIKQLLAVENLDCIQTVDSRKLCEKLNKRLIEQKRALHIFTQVKISDEESKHGIDPSHLGELLGFIKSDCPQLKFKGLMTIGPPGDAEVFKKLRILKENVEAAEDYADLDLSMGMSGDYKTAILEGATVVRIGSALFGERIYKEK